MSCINVYHYQLEIGSPKGLFIYSSGGFRRVLEDAAEDNPNLRVVFC